MAKRRNWKTSIAGIATILAAIATPILPVVGVPAAIVSAIATALAGVGLVAAKDHDVTGGTRQQ